MIMKVQGKRKDVWARVCVREEVSGPGESRGCWKEFYLPGDSPQDCCVSRVCWFASDKVLGNFPQRFIMKNFKHVERIVV